MCLAVVFGLYIYQAYINIVQYKPSTPCVIFFLKGAPPFSNHIEPEFTFKWAQYSAFLMTKPAHDLIYIQSWNRVSEVKPSWLSIILLQTFFSWQMHVVIMWPVSFFCFVIVHANFDPNLNCSMTSW